MLGLGNSLTQNSVLREITAPFSYSRDVIGSEDGWTAQSVSGNPVLDYNATAPDSTDGWMKLTFDEAQTDFWALRNSTILDGRVEVGSTATFSYDIFLDTAALWGDGSGTISWQSFYGGRPTSNTAVTAGSTSSTAISGSVSATSTSSIIQLRQGGYEAEDLPLAGAEVYIKNLSISIAYT